MELPVYPVERTGDCRIADGGSNLAATQDPSQAYPPHQEGNGAPGHILSLPPELAPYLARAIDAEIRVEHALDVGHQGQVTLGPRRLLAGSARRAAWAW
jgi:hypothetical protein